MQLPRVLSAIVGRFAKNFINCLTVRMVLAGRGTSGQWGGDIMYLSPMTVPVLCLRGMSCLLNGWEASNCRKTPAVRALGLTDPSSWGPCSGAWRGSSEGACKSKNNRISWMALHKIKMGSIRAHSFLQHHPHTQSVQINKLMFHRLVSMVSACLSIEVPGAPYTLV